MPRSANQWMSLEQIAIQHQIQQIRKYKKSHLVFPEVRCQKHPNDDFCTNIPRLIHDHNLKLSKLSIEQSKQLEILHLKTTSKLDALTLSHEFVCDSSSCCFKSMIKKMKENNFESRVNDEGQNKKKARKYSEAINEGQQLELKRNCSSGNHVKGRINIKLNGEQSQRGSHSQILRRELEMVKQIYQEKRKRIEKKYEIRRVEFNTNLQKAIKDHLKYCDFN